MLMLFLIAWVSREGGREGGREGLGFHHKDLPQKLQDRYQGWWSPVTSDAFADYADVGFDRLGGEGGREGGEG